MLCLLINCVWDDEYTDFSPGSTKVEQAWLWDTTYYRRSPTDVACTSYVPCASLALAAGDSCASSAAAALASLR